MSPLTQSLIGWIREPAGVRQDTVVLSWPRRLAASLSTIHWTLRGSGQVAFAPSHSGWRAPYRAPSLAAFSTAT